MSGRDGLAAGSGGAIATWSTDQSFGELGRGRMMRGGINYGPPSVAALRQRGASLIRIQSKISLYRHARGLQKVRAVWLQKDDDQHPNIVIRRTLPYLKGFPPLDFPIQKAAM